MRILAVAATEAEIPRLSTGRLAAHDLDVLIGFQTMLTERRIDFVETEVAMNRVNTQHVPLEAVKDFLEPLGYHLFHFYELGMETPLTGRPVLRRAA